MSDLKRRLASLTPEQRRLFELRSARQETTKPGATEGTGVDLAGLPGSSVDDGPPAAMDFSLFFFSADGSTTGAKYDLLLDAARFGDNHGFTAVWTPERHFQDFGGLYPNPSVLGAALAVATERLEIRAGSVVLPLHHPARIAEEWAVVDNLSHGRAAIACATGWHPGDFVVRPEAFDDRRETTFQTVEVLRRMWVGEEVEFTAGDGSTVAVRSLPRPVRPSLPMWLTSSGNTATWEKAGELGTNVLTSFGSQPFPDLERKVERYRAARRRAGYNDDGVVSVMLHTFLGDDVEEVKETVREPLSEYLRTHLAQRDSFMDLPAITDDDKEALIPMAFEHYVRQASLIGTSDSVSPLVNRLARAGVDEIACLIDFGPERDEVMASLEHVAELVRRHRSPAEDGRG